MSLGFLWNLCAPFRARAVIVLILVALDSVLASLGIGMIVPVTSAVLLPQEKLASGNSLFSWLEELPYAERVTWLAAATLLVFAVKAGVSMAQAFLARDFSERMRCFWIRNIGERYLHGTLAALSMRRQGEVINNWFNEPGAAARFLLGYMGYLSALLLTAALLIVGLIVDWRITIAFVLGGLVFGLMLHRSAYGRVARLSGAKLDHHQRLAAEMSESVSQLREVKLLGLENRRVADVLQIAEGLKSILVRLGVSSEAPRIVGELVTVTIFVSALIGLVVLAARDAREVIPLLAFFFVAFYRLVTAGMQVVSGRIKVLSDLRSAELVHRLSTMPYQREGTRDALHISAIATDIAFKQVEFGYPGGELVLKGLSLTIAKGKRTFLVGASGAGKSTILDLLLRLYSPSSGQIVANSRSIDEFDLASWRSRLGYVSQDAALFHGTIRANLQVGLPDASDEDIVEACELAGVNQFISELPAGLNTVVGHRGYALSGGQAKRVAIARMLVRQPDFLILDEATSAFEQAMEDAIIDRVRNRYPKMGVLQVSHRLDSARLADQIIVLDQGRITVAGTWTEVTISNREYFVGR